MVACRTDNDQEEMFHLTTPQLFKRWTEVSTVKKYLGKKNKNSGTYI